MNAGEAIGITPHGATAGTRRHGLAVVGLVPLSEWLFFEQPIGLSVAVFAAAVVAATVWANASSRNGRTIRYAALALGVALLPVLESSGVFQVAFATLGLALFALVVAGRFTGTAAERAGRVARLIGLGPFRLVPDILRSRAVWKRQIVTGLSLGTVIAWILPLVFSAAFVALFAEANPLIDGWLDNIDFSAVWSKVEPARFLFWLASASVVWPLVCVRSKDRQTGPGHVARYSESFQHVPDALFGSSTVLPSLLTFNALFAVQTTMDLAYLWGGLELPEGVTYAAYAHRGAYPLIVVALLSAGFVLLAMRPGSEAERAPFVRVLVLAWIAQNVLLVISAMLRLDLYVETYSLTLWRIAAFVWMGLVACGLVLIVVRILFDKPNSWLVAANAIALTVTLYASCFVPWPSVVTTFNVNHSYEISGAGPSLDIDYLCRLGPQAIPGLADFVGRLDDKPAAKRSITESCIARKKREQEFAMQNWRNWTLRNLLLSRYLNQEADVKTGPVGR